MAACQEQHVLTVNMLIDNGAHVNLQNEVSYVLYFVVADRYAIYTIQHSDIPCHVDLLFNTCTNRIAR